MMTPTSESVPRPASAAAVTSAVSPGIGNACGFDHEKDGDEYVPVLTDPLIYNVEHPLVTGPGWGSGMGTETATWEGRKLDGSPSRHKRRAST